MVSPGLWTGRDTVVRGKGGGGLVLSSGLGFQGLLFGGGSRVRVVQGVQVR
jgi:hypothetical protein